MTIIELHLDRPAFKRVEAGPEAESTAERQSTTGIVGSSEESEESGGGGSMVRRLLLVAMVGAVAFAVMRWRRGGPEEQAAIDIGTEETRPQTE